MRFPDRVGRYELLLPIASGGMGTVYLAVARSLGGFEREVALKLVHAHLDAFEDFRLDAMEEAKLAARIRHPNVVPVLDIGEDPAGVFLVMDYVEGDSLNGLARAAEHAGGRLPAGIGLRILLDALAGLHAAHELVDAEGRPLALVHRDVSPQNILVGLDGIGRLTDFGIAKAATRPGHTQTGATRGKVSYMSPEQARAEPLDRRCDIWAAGVIAWEMLAQRALYARDNNLQALLSIARNEPPRLRAVRPEVPPALEEAVAGALAHDARRRCPTAAALARRLEEACGDALELADTEEVAAYVRRLIGPKVEERRRAVAEALARGNGPPASNRDDPPVSRRDGPPASRRQTSGRDRATALAAAGSIAVAAAALAVAFWRGPSAAPPPLEAAPAPPLPAGPEAPSSAPALPEAPPAPRRLLIAADAPIRDLHVGERRVPIDRPRQTLSLELFAEEYTQEVTITATSDDGRRIVAPVPSEDTLELRFPPRAPGAAAPKERLPKLVPNPYRP